MQCQTWLICQVHNWSAGVDFWNALEQPYNEYNRLRARRLGRPPSGKGLLVRATTWFDEVAAPRMHHMYTTQKDAVKGHDQDLEQQVQALTRALIEVRFR